MFITLVTFSYEYFSVFEICIWQLPWNYYPGWFWDSLCSKFNSSLWETFETLIKVLSLGTSYYKLIRTLLILKKKGRKANRREVEESARLKFSDILCCHKCFPVHGHATKWLSLALSQAKAAGGPWLMLSHQHHRCGQILIIPQTDHGTNFYLSPCHKIWQLSWLH